MAAAAVEYSSIIQGSYGPSLKKAMINLEESLQGKLQGIISAVITPVTDTLKQLDPAIALANYTGTAAQLGQLSQSPGMSVEELQAWQYAAEATGGKAKDVGVVFRNMSSAIVKATTLDSGPLKDIAKALDVELRDARGNVRGTVDVMLDLADAFQRVGPQQAVAFGTQPGITPGMIQLMQQGRAGIEAFARAQRELGGCTREDVQIASSAKRALTDLEHALQAAAAPVARVLVPVMTRLAETIRHVTLTLRENKPLAISVFTGIATVLTGLLIPASVKLAAAWLSNPLNGLLAAIAAAIVAAGLAISDLIAYMDGGNAVFADFWSLFGTGPEIAEALGEAWENLKATGSALFAGLVDGVKLFFQNFSGVFSGLAQIVTGVLQVIKGLFTADFDSIVEGIGNVFTGVGETIGGIFDGIVKTVSDAFRGVVNAVGQWFTDMLASIPGLGWALEKMGVVDSEETKTATLTPSTADSGNIAAQADRQAARNITSTSSMNVGDIIVYTNNQDTAQDVGNAVSDGLTRVNRNQALALSAQTGVAQK